MKKTISILCVAVLLMMMVGLAACSSGNAGGGQDISGTYKLVEMNSGGEDMTSMLTLINVTMTIEGDTAVVGMMDDTLEWKVDTGRQTFTNADGASVPYRIEEDRLIVEGGEDSSYGKMVFEKQEEN